MDTELLRTFLEVRRTRHFGKAADNLCLTQAAVSARIKQLESTVGQRLFTRTRNDIQLTPAAHQLVPYAEAILSTWTRALMESSHHGEGRTILVLGCLPSLNEILLAPWLAALDDDSNNWLLQVESLSTEELVHRVRQRSITLGLVYEPPRASDLWVQPLTVFDLVMVSSRANAVLQALIADYIYVDWGSSFAASHNTLTTQMGTPKLKLDTPRIAHRLLLQRGGSAFLAMPMVREDLESGRLHLVPDTPVVQRRVYLIGSGANRHDRDSRALTDALQRSFGSDRVSAPAN